MAQKLRKPGIMGDITNSETPKQESEETSGFPEERNKRLTNKSGFIPQFDHELARDLCPRKPKYDSSVRTSPGGSPSFYTCKECRLKCLQGREGEDGVSMHPSHHTTYNRCYGTRRSLLVFLDVAYTVTSSNVYAGYGVYFSADSSYNLSKPLHPDKGEPVWSPQATLHALLALLKIVRNKIFPERIAFVAGAGRPNSQTAIADATMFRLVVETKDYRLVDEMCVNQYKWMYHEHGGITNKKGKPIKYAEDIMAIRGEISVLAELGIEVVYHLLSRKEATPAEEMAKMALAQAVKESLLEMRGDMVKPSN